MMLRPEAVDFLKINVGKGSLAAQLLSRPIKYLNYPLARETPRHSLIIASSDIADTPPSPFIMAIRILAYYSWTQL